MSARSSRTRELVVLVAAIGLAGYAVLALGLTELWGGPSWWQTPLVWFAAAVVLHDLLLFPLYALVDRVLARARPTRTTVPVVNHVRLPLLGAALTFVLFFPGIVQQGARTFEGKTGLTQEPYLERWLWLCFAFAAASAVVYGVRRVTAARRRRG